MIKVFEEKRPAEKKLFEADKVEIKYCVKGQQTATLLKGRCLLHTCKSRGKLGCLEYHGR